MLRGKRKFIAFWGALAFGLTGFIVWLVAMPREIAALVAFLGLIGTCLEFFNRSNLKEHENGQPK